VKKRNAAQFLAISLVPAFFLLGCCTEEWEGPREDPLLITPYVNASDMKDTLGDFLAIHHGLDFFPIEDDKPFQAAAPGRVTNVELFYNTISEVWQVNIWIKYNSVFTESYSFEPCSDIADANIQMDLILVSVGQMVNAGDEIGKLHMVGDGAHVHFGLLRNWVATCPYPYFEASARESILALDAVDHKMCDCHP
jgi:hypothetical protein